MGNWWVIYIPNEPKATLKGQYRRQTLCNLYQLCERGLMGLDCGSSI